MVTPAMSLHRTTTIPLRLIEYGEVFLLRPFIPFSWNLWSRNLKTPNTSVFSVLNLRPSHFKWIQLHRNTYCLNRNHSPLQSRHSQPAGPWSKETVKSHDWLDTWAKIFTNSTPDTFPKISFGWSKLEAGSARLEHLQTFTSLVHETIKLA